MTPPRPVETRPFFRNLALSRLGAGVGLRLGGHLLLNALRGERGRDRARVARGATDLKMLRLDLPAAVHDTYAHACEIIVEPFNDHIRDGTPPHLLNADGAYRWADSDMLSRASAATARSAMTVHFRLPPPGLVFLNRRLMGAFVMLGALRAEFNARQRLLRAVGLNPAPGVHAAA